VLIGDGWGRWLPTLLLSLKEGVDAAHILAYLV